MSHTTAHVNGRFLPREQATVSALDRGFLYADGIYELLPCYGGRPYRLTQHLARLQRSLDGIGLDNPLDDNAWATLIHGLIDRNGGGDLHVYLQVTRGAPPARDHWTATPVAPTVVGFTGPLHVHGLDQAATGVRAITRPDDRWAHCDVKSVALLPNILARRAAAEAGAFEAVFLRGGLLTEGAATNVFVVRNGTITTPPLAPSILPGITRGALIECLAGTEHAVAEAPVSEDALRSADEIWLSSSTREILPVVQLDDRVLGERAGPVWQAVAPRFSAFVQAELDA